MKIKTVLCKCESVWHVCLKIHIVRSLRCSQCGWELDEEHFCATCGIQYETEGTSRANATEISDTESHHEFEEDLSDFVVDDNEVAYSPDNSEDEILRNIDRRTEETHSPLIGRDPSNAIEIDDGI